MPHHPNSPCSTCPYRKAVPVRHWHLSEFEKLTASETSQLGAVFACHKHAALVPAKRGLCAGWLLDQKKRRLPSIMLRLLLLKKPDAVTALKAVNDGGHKLYSTWKAMCRDNGFVPRSIPTLPRKNLTRRPPP